MQNRCIGTWRRAFWGIGGWRVELDDHAGRVDVGVRKPDRIDDPFAASVAWPKVDEEDLVDIMVNDLTKFIGEDCFFGIGQLAFENAQLQVIPRVSHGSKDVAKSFWVADIVGDKVGVAHGSPIKKIRQQIHGKECPLI